MRKTARFQIQNPAIWKSRLLAWAQAHEAAVLLDSNDYPARHSPTWDCLVAAGRSDSLEKNAGEGAFEALKNFAAEKQDWLFGGFGYDLKNEVEHLQSGHPDGIGFPDLWFFQPEAVVGLRGKTLHIFSKNRSPETLHRHIRSQKIQAEAAAGEPLLGAARLQAAMPRDEYLATVEQIRHDIEAGDFYEMNLCQAFFADDVGLDPAAFFARLNGIGKAPFSAFVRWGERFLCCASPERFLKKTGQTLVSQPIKGTRRRGRNAGEDAEIAQQLADSEKDRAENVMIVDLVRNDLARFCRPGSVQVEEIFGIYPFETVFQMISTVRGDLRPDAHPLDALRAAFPPGSMTGAPKVMAMQRIEQYEKSRRGLYSGAIGYISPEGDFDFNVVIRSVLYNRATRYLSFHVGGAIVFDSVPEQEYEECLLKAQGMMRALGIRA